MQYVPVVLGKRFDLRIEDLNENHIIEVSCLACRRKGRVFASQLIHRHPKHRRLIELVQKFRCVHCKSKEVANWKLYQIV